MYGIILNEKDGVATVEMVDSLGEKLVLSNVPMYCLDIGEEVDKGYLEGKVMECRYRFYLIPQSVNKDSDDENLVVENNMWRQGQVESVFTAGDGDLMIKFRSRKTDRFLLLEANQFLELCLPSNMKDYILGVGDKSKNMSRADIHNLMSGCDREALRQRRRSSEKHVYLSSVGGWMHTTMGKEIPLKSSRRDGESRSVGGRRESVEVDSESFRQDSVSVRHGSESSRKNSGNKQKQKSVRMRVHQSGSQGKGRQMGGNGGSSGGDNPSDSDGWRAPNLSTDAEDAGYGNKKSGGKESSSGGPRGGPSNGGVNHDRRIPLQEPQDRQGRGGGRRTGGGGRGNGKENNNQDSNRKASDSQRRVSHESKGSDGDSDGGKSWEQGGGSESSTKTSKHEFAPRQGARARHQLIFREDVLSTTRGLAGDRLDIILRNERHSTPGFTLGHAAALYGFDFGIQPVPIWDIKNVGGVDNYAKWRKRILIKQSLVLYSYWRHDSLL